MEYGILRSFANAAERDTFYVSPLYVEWKKKVAPLSDGEPDTRELHGLEAFFRGNTPSSASLENGHCYLSRRRSHHHDPCFDLGTTHPPLEFRFVQLGFQRLCRAAFDWVVMPLITRALHGWLNAK